jgi:hypothetical protein
MGVKNFQNKGNIERDVVCMEEMRHTYRVSVGKPEGIESTRKT